MSDKCKNCKFYKKYKQEKITRQELCRIKHPTFKGFPETQANEWCGEYEEDTVLKTTEIASEEIKK